MRRAIGQNIWRHPVRESPRCVYGLSLCRLPETESFKTTARWNLSQRVRVPSVKNVSGHLYNQRRYYIAGGENDNATIYALSTAPGRAAIAIVRISGPAAVEIYRALCPQTRIPKPRLASLRTLYEPGSPIEPDSILDSNALVLYFPAPNTVTGEDVLELHVHGGPAVVKAVLAAISKCNESNTRRIRYAEPGEFTRRAFINNRLDLTQVEALGDTLSATTEKQRRLSVRGTTNQLAQRYDGWRQQLLYARGELEALIDFSEDQHFDESPAELCASVAEQVFVLRRMLNAHIKNAMKGELLRNGISISLLGAPNAGKSSLLNCIIGREAAIVSHEAGTTRDIVEVGIDLGGYFCRLGDTAGLRKATQDAVKVGKSEETIGQVEKEGMRRARERAAKSDVVIVVLSLEKEDPNAPCTLYLDPEVVTTATELIETKDNVHVVINKSDLLSRDSHFAKEGAVQATLQALPGISHACIHAISCKEDAEAKSPDLMHANRGAAVASRNDDVGGIQALLQSLIRHFGTLTAAATPDLDNAADGADPSIWQDSLGATERHRLLLEDCVRALGAFIDEVGGASNGEFVNDAGAGDGDIVLAAEHLRTAADCLAKITGRGEAGDVEEVLGVVFEKFCVGK